MKAIFNFQFSIFNSKRGFTLIELLLVVAIIGLLVGFSIINLIGVRSRARDGDRKTDLKAIQSAFELYRADQGSYPAAPLPACGAPLTGGTSTYLNAMPCDSLDGTSYVYNAPSGPPPPQTYTLSACLENVNDQDKDASDGAAGDTCPATGRVSYTVKNP